MKLPPKLQSREKLAPTKTGSGSRSLAQKVASLNRFREQFNPLINLNLRRAVSLASDYYRGVMADLQWTYFFVEQTDPDLIALLALRFGRLQEMDYNILTRKDADPKLAEEQADFLSEKFDLIDNLYDVIEHFGMADFRGFAHVEKWYEGGELTHLEIVDQWNVVRNGLRGDWKYNPEARVATFDSLPADALMDPQNFLIREVRRPINRIALYKFVRSNLNEVDWDAFNAIYGIPGGVVIGPADVPVEKETEYAAAANQIADGGSGYLPYGSQYTQNKGPTGNNPFKERLDHLTEKLILAGTAGKLTMLVAPTGLGSGTSNKHGDAFDSIVSAEARRISGVFNKDLVCDWLDAGFPGQPHEVYFGLAANEETNVSQMVTDIKGLSDAGYQLTEEEVAERTGYEVTLKAPPVITPPGQLGQPGQPAKPAPGAAATDPELGGEDAKTITNRAGSAGKDIVFKATAAELQLAARREVFRPIAERLAKIDAIQDPEQRRAAVIQFKADAGQLYAAVVAKAPDLAKPAEEAIGTALVSGFVQANEARNLPAPQIENKAHGEKTASTPRKNRRKRS